MEANGIPHAPLEARRSLRVGLVRDIFDTVTRSKECFLNNFQLPASHIEPLFNTRHLVMFPLPSTEKCCSAVTCGRNDMVQRSRSSPTVQSIDGPGASHGVCSRTGRSGRSLVPE